MGVRTAAHCTALRSSLAPVARGETDGWPGIAGDGVQVRKSHRAAVR